MSYARLFTLFLLFISKASYSQKEAATWFFGYSAGLNFNTKDPTALAQSSLKAVEGTAVISDKLSGDFLFYTDGRNFWNSMHQLMPSSKTLSTNCATGITQSAIIIPDINSNFLYHTLCIRPISEFTQGTEPSCFYTRTEVLGEGLALFYYLIDMRLDEGRGDIVSEKSNVVLTTNITEKLTVVPHSNGKDYWVIVHGWNSNRFYTHQLTSEILLPPVITDIGSIHGFHDYTVDVYQELSGQIKASPDGRKIACAVGLQERPFDLFDFNSFTGKLSNYINLGNILGQYGVSFSPDNSKLYVTSDGREPNSNLRSIILQFDINAGSQQDIIDSRVSIVANNPYTNMPESGVFDGFDLVKKGMALGIDGRLYIAGNSDYTDTSNEPHVMAVINRPNEKGFDCDVNQTKFDFKSGRVTIGLPNFIQSYFNNIESSSICSEASSVMLFPNPTNNVVKVKLLEGCDQNIKIEIFNSIGQKILITDNQIIYLTGLANGVYLFKIFTTYRSNIVKRVVKI